MMMTLVPSTEKAMRCTEIPAACMAVSSWWSASSPSDTMLPSRAATGMRSTIRRGMVIPTKEEGVLQPVDAFADVVELDQQLEEAEEHDQHRQHQGEALERVAAQVDVDQFKPVSHLGPRGRR